MANRYAEALGIMQFTVNGLEFKLKPRKGDNLELLKLQQTYSKDSTKFLEEFARHFVSMVVRDQGIPKGSEEYQDLETFVEFNVMDIFREVAIAFRWTTREKWEEAEKKQVEGFQTSLRNQ